MKKLLILLFAVVLAVVNSTAKDVTFAPDFKDGKSWTTPEARFSEQSKFRFDESNSNKKMLLIRRGAIRPAVIFTEELGENQDFSYSFEFSKSGIITADESPITCGNLPSHFSKYSAYFK